MLEKFKSMFSKDIMEIRINDVDSKVTSLEEKSGSEKIASARDAAAADLSKLRVLLEGLAKKSVTDNYVNVLKDRFCEKGIKLLSSLPSDSEKFLEISTQALQEISGISMKEFRHFHAFKDDMGLVAAQVKVSNESLEDFRKTYHGSRQKKTSDIFKLAQRIRQDQASLGLLEKQINEIEKAIPFIRESLERNERSLAEADKKIGTENSDTDETISSLSSEMSIIKQKISTELGSIDRIFKKIEHESPGKYACLRSYVHNSGQAFLADDDLEIRTILEDAKHEIKKEDPEKYEKVEDLLRNLDFFESLRQQYKGLETRVAGLKERRDAQMRPLEKEKAHAKTSIEDAQSEISQLLERRSAKNEEKERLVADIARCKAELTEKLRDLMQRDVRLTE